MNVLRKHRKSNKKIKIKKYVLFIFSLIMTTFAWLAYSKVLNTHLNIHVAAWDMEYYIGDEKKENIVDRNKVQGNNEPLYFLAEENGVKVMKPRNILKNNADFIDYYVIRVSWKAGEVHEDKETDIVYLTASR